MVDPIPTDVKEFILRRIDSIAELEALLLLRNDASRNWSGKELAERLYVSVGDAEAVLERLHARQLATLSNPSAYRYGPLSSDIREVVDRLSAVYAKHLVPVSKLVHSKSRLRMQELADAFKLRKEPE